MARLRLRNTEVAPSRYPSLARQPNNKRKAWRTRTSRKLTEMERYRINSIRQQYRDNEHAALDEARQVMWDLAKKMHERLRRHNVRHYHRLIMHQSRIKVGARRTNRWNAFLSLRLKERNDALPEGEERIRVSEDVVKDIAAEWHAMTAEEKTSATEARMRELDARTENRKHGSQTFTVNAFHDARSIVAHVQQLLEDLYIRTGTETVMVNCRPTTADYMQPNVFLSSDRLRDFVTVAAGGTVEDLAEKMEGYCISGIQGVALTYVQNIGKLRKQASKLILSSLRSTSTRGHVGRMWYVNFDAHITYPLGVVLDFWPLKSFCAPGDLSSAVELETLIQAFQSGRTKFRLLADAEWKEWREKYLASRTGAAPGSSHVADSPTSTSPSVSSPSSASSPESREPFASPRASSTPEPHTTAPMSSTTSTSALTAPPSPPVQASTDAELIATPPRKRARQTTTFVMVDVVTGPDGRPVQIPKRDRSARKKKDAKSTTQSSLPASTPVSSPPRDLSSGASSSSSSSAPSPSSSAWGLSSAGHSFSSTVTPSMGELGKTSRKRKNATRS